MRAVVYRGEGTYTLDEVPTPEPGRGEVLIRVEANTICGTDLRIASGQKRKGVHPPVVLGHELAGTVAGVGDGVVGIQAGDKVGMTPSIACQACPECLRGRFNLCLNAVVLGHNIDGGLAEYFLAPSRAVFSGNVVRAPDRLAAEEIALAEPLSCVLHGQRLMDIAVNNVVVIMGGGAIGQLHAQLARASGAGLVIVSEPVESRRQLALTLGADIVVDPREEVLADVVSTATDGHGADAVIVCIGVPALVDDALRVVRQRGRVCLFAGFPADQSAPIDPNTVHYKELFVSGSSNSTPAEYAEALRIIADGRIDVRSLVTHRFALSEMTAALEAGASPDALKVAVMPGR